MFCAFHYERGQRIIIRSDCVSEWRNAEGAVALGYSRRRGCKTALLTKMLVLLLATTKVGPTEFTECANSGLSQHTFAISVATYDF